MQVTIKFEDNGKPIVLTGDFDEVTMECRKVPGMAVRSLWFDVEELDGGYEVAVYNTSDEWDEEDSDEWQVDGAFRWKQGADIHEEELSSKDTDFEITFK